MIQFFSPEIKSSPVLGPQESLHCVRVLRKKVGDVIPVTDGKGSLYDCEITVADSKKVVFDILSEKKVPKNWPFQITLALAPTKNADRMSWLVEKSVEIGIDRICFFPSRFSERKNINVERLERVAISAMNQSLKCQLPEIEQLQRFDSLLNLAGDKYFGYCNEALPRLIFSKEFRPGNDVVITIGPEGDFSKEEVDAMLNAGFKAVTFGNERLRTETAALYGVTAVHVLYDLNFTEN